MTGEEIYGLVAAHRWELRRHLGQEGEDTMHDCYVLAVRAFARGKIDHPAAYIHGIVRHTILQRIRFRARERSFVSPEEVHEGWLAWDGPSPEGLAIAAESGRRAVAAMAMLTPRQRELLTRAYAQGQTVEHIRDEMGLTDTQFRLTKSRARRTALTYYRGGRGPGRKRLPA